VGAIAHYLEDSGIPTTSISLVRENTVLIRPPRALWVPFELGRPFGTPNEPQFQLRVVRAALGLLERSDGTVILEDFPDDAPGQGDADSMEGLVCPVSFRVPASGDRSDPLTRILAEVEQLAPWHEVFVDSCGESMVGVSALPVADAARLLDEIRVSGKSATIEDEDLGKALRFASEDVRNWYLEAASARPGGAAAPRELADWFWGETSAGELILTLHPLCLASDNPQLRSVATSMLVPRAQHHRLTG
jgi:hypothetical protein